MLNSVRFLLSVFAVHAGFLLALAEEDVVKSCALIALLAGGRSSGPPAAGFARPKRSGVAATPTARWPPPTDLRESRFTG